MKGVRVLASACIAIAALVTSSALAQPERQLRDINQQAMTAYAGLELETAKSLLEQALQIAARANVTSGRALAQTYLNLGVVAIGGFGDNAGGINYFVNALAADPTITLDPNTSTPDVQALFAQARARGPRTASVTPTTQTDAAATLLHTAVEEQLVDYPIPIFVQVPPQFRAVEVLLRYRSGGTGMFASFVMDRVSNGYGVEIPCAAIHSASVQYYIEARDAQRRVVARVATEAQPVNVRIVQRRTRAVISLPTRSPPESCRAAQAPPPPSTPPPPTPPPAPARTPPPASPMSQSTTPDADVSLPVPELRSTGTGIVGDVCEETSDCSGELRCEDARCTAPEAAAPAELSRVFFHLGYSGGWVAVRPGMEADSTVPYDPRFKPEGWNDAINGAYAPPGYTESEWRIVIALTYPSYRLPSDGPVPGSGDPRVNDVDCKVDADRYCVRVTQEGIRPVGALRFELGYWLTRRLGLSFDMRTGTHAGRGTLARNLFGLRVHALLTPLRVTGAHITAFAGGGVGQIQGRVPQGRYEGPDLVRPSTGLVYLRSGTKIHEPWTTSGLGHVQAGLLFGYRFTERLGIVVEPVLYLMFPRFAFATDTTVSASLAF